MFKKSCFATIIIFIVSMFWLSTNVFADDCSLGRTPEGIYPMDENDIEMTSEEINVDVENEYATCKFVFKNTGKEKDILMGFPAEGEENENDHLIGANLKITNFNAYSNGLLLPVKLEKGVKPKNVGYESLNIDDRPFRNYSSWYTFTVHFKEGEEKIVKNNYSFRSSKYSSGDVLTGYIINTGSFWKGKIGKAKVYFNMGNIKPYMVNDIVPAAYFRFEGNNLVFECSNFEPEINLKILYNTVQYSNEFMNIMDEQSKKNIVEGIKLYENIDKNLKSKDKNRIAEDFNNAVIKNKPVMVKYILSSIPKGTIRDNGPEITGIGIKGSGNGNDNKFLIDIIVKDEFCDINELVMKITHEENGNTVVDMENKKNVLGNYISIEYRDSYFFAFIPGIKYKVYCEVIDLEDNKKAAEVNYCCDNSVNTDPVLLSGAIDKEKSKQVSIPIQNSKGPIKDSRKWIKPVAIGGGFLIFSLLAAVYLKHNHKRLS